MLFGGNDGVSKMIMTMQEDNVSNDATALMEYSHVGYIGDCICVDFDFETHQFSQSNLQTLRRAV